MEQTKLVDSEASIYTDAKKSDEEIGPEQFRDIELKDREIGKKFKKCNAMVQRKLHENEFR